MVDAIVREWLCQVIGVDAMKIGLSQKIRLFLAAFFADDGLVQARCPVELQSALYILVKLCA